MRAESQATGAEELVTAMRETRERTLELVSGLSVQDLEAIHSELMSPLVWDLGHIAAYEDLWLAHRFGGLELLREDLAEVYDAFETPRSERADAPFLRHGEALEYLEEVSARTIALTQERGIEDGTLHELVVRHEQQHCETMLQTIQLARLVPSAADHDAGAVSSGALPSGLDLVEVPAGEFLAGARAEGFAYDNERPAYRVHLPAFRIGRTPVTNGDWLEFVRAGGYQRREWWSDHGWSWRQAERATAPLAWDAACEREWRLGRWAELDPARAVVHVCWHEAEAFARSVDARLPSEAEWEKAALWDPQAGRARTQPWGEDAPQPGVHGNFDARRLGPDPVDAHPAGASAYGALAMIGDVWEWTATEFDGYPGFRAHPYKEYSEVFFRRGYRVLRGNSWASRSRAVTPTFRNWDLPQRRQIFAGLRIARDA